MQKRTVPYLISAIRVGVIYSEELRGGIDQEPVKA